MKLPNPILQFLRWFPRQEFTLLLCLLFVIGLIGGRALMSIGMISLLANAFINIEAGENLKRFRNNHSAILLTGLFILIGLSFFWSTNTDYYTGRMQLFLPFLAMPLAFQSIKWKPQYFTLLLLTYVGVCLLGAGWSILQYLENKEVIDHAYGLSKSLPTPFGGDHIRFGVAVVIAIVFCIQFIKEKIKVSWAIALVAVLLMVYLHILASKTALLALYIVIFYELILLIIKKKKIILGFALMTVLFILPFVFYVLSTSFRNKINYSNYAIQQLFNDTPETNISDEGRIISYQTALHVFKNNWLVGVGVGDGLDVMQATYAERNIETEKILYPHNQFLYMALVLGILGLGYFIFLILYLFYKYFGKSPWLSAFLLVFIVPLNVEAFFNTQYGIALFLFFFLLLERKYKLAV